MIQIPCTISGNSWELISEKIFKDVGDCLDAAGLMMHGGSIVDATIIAAPSSTKNQEEKRDPEMHQTKKVTQWHFGMKIHSCVDAGSGYTHTITQDICEFP